MPVRPLLAIAIASGLAAAPLSAQDDAGDGAEQSAIAETFGIETGPENFRDIEIDGLSAEALAGSKILGRQGDRIGTVTDVLIVEDEADKIVMAIDGTFGEPRRTVLIPLDEVQIQRKDDETFRLRTTLSDEAVDGLAEYNAI